jgi:hypothetical protein
LQNDLQYLLGLKPEMLREKRPALESQPPELREIRQFCSRIEAFDGGQLPTILSGVSRK